MDSVRRSERRTLALVVVIFALGVLVGALTTRAMQARRLRALLAGDPATLRNQMMLRALERRLGLSPSQRAQAERVLEAQSQPYRDALEPCRPRVRALRLEMRRALAPTLDPAQREALDTLVRDGERYR